MGGLLYALGLADRGRLGGCFFFLTFLTPYSPAKQSIGGLVIVPGEVPPAGPPGAGGRPSERGS